MPALLLETTAESRSWAPGAVCAGVLAVTGLLMLLRSGSLPVPVKGVVRSMALVALLVAVGLFVLGWLGMAWMALGLVTVVLLLLVLGGTGVLATRAERLAREGRGRGESVVQERREG
ncbi:hypothetical protein [Kytococcus sp. Marseille-QA3725]